MFPFSMEFFVPGSCSKLLEQIESSTLLWICATNPESTRSRTITSGWQSTLLSTLNYISTMQSSSTNIHPILSLIYKRTVLEQISYLDPRKKRLTSNQCLYVSNVSVDFDLIQHIYNGFDWIWTKTCHIVAVTAAGGDDTNRRKPIYPVYTNFDDEKTGKRTKVCDDWKIKETAAKTGWLLLERR